MRTLQIIIVLAMILISSLQSIAENQNTQTVIQPSVKTRNRATKAMNNLLHGPIGPCQPTPQSQECRDESIGPSRNNPSGPGKDIAKIISGAWQLATFWSSNTNAAADCDPSNKK